MDPFSETQTEILNRMIIERSKNVIGDEEIILHEVDEWEKSSLRKMMMDGQRYYENEHDILERKRMMVLVRQHCHNHIFKGLSVDDQ